MINEKELAVGILAGGKSTRMGTDKTLIRIGQKRMIDRIAGELSCFAEVIISAAAAGRYEDMGYSVVYDERRDAGPMEGIRQILAGASREYVFICAADMPHISADLVRYLLGYICSDYDCFAVVGKERVQPLCAIYKRSILPVIDQYIRAGRYRLYDLLQGVRTKSVFLKYTEFKPDILRNVNTREDLRAARLPVCFCVSGFSDSGKTGLIVELVKAFVAEGYTVNVLKHDGCGHYADVEGSDTARFTRAGARCSGIYNESRFFLQANRRIDVEAMLGLMAAAGKADVFIVEGLKDSDLPKVEIVRNTPEDCIIPVRKNIICTVSDRAVFSGQKVPVFRCGDTGKIYRCIKAYFHLD